MHPEEESVIAMLGVVLPFASVAPGAVGTKGTQSKWGFSLDKQQAEEEKEDKDKMVPTGDGRCNGMAVLRDGQGRRDGGWYSRLM